MTKEPDTSTQNLRSYSNSGNSNIRKQVFSLLDGNGQSNPLLTPKQICKLLSLSYKQYHNYVAKTKWEWKYYYKNERGSNCSNFHCFKAKGRLDKELSVALRGVVSGDWVRGGLGFGWVASRARNRFWVWKGKFGRAVWFETGLVGLNVRRPGNLGKAKQLFCDAFVNTGLITDFKVLNPILEQIRPKSGHFPYSAGARLPYMVIHDFEQSHGIVIKVGDRTHPDSVEVIASFSDTLDTALDKLERLEKNGEKNNQALTRITGILSNLFEADSDKQHCSNKSLGDKSYVT
ncbi:MAG: hypothetical protein NWF01_06935 [Candidatus Bathyarchaeota archaeon]|nr:hypothetical protein [Candidatus Bathyarchaeota archaeon]